MQGAIEARRAEDDLVRTCLGVVDEFLERLPGLLVVDHEHARICHEARERDEVRIGEFRLAPKQPVDLGEAADRGDVGEERIAVRLGVGGDLRPDLAGCARLRVDHHRLLHDRLEHGGKGPRHHVGGAAGRKRVDDGDGAGRIGVLRERRARGGRYHRTDKGGRADDEAASVHAIPPFAPPVCGDAIFLVFEFS